MDAWLPELAHPMVMRDLDGSPEQVYPVGDASPFYTQFGEDFFTLIYHAITD